MEFYILLTMPKTPPGRGNGACPRIGQVMDIKMNAASGLCRALFGVSDQEKCRELWAKVRKTNDNSRVLRDEVYFIVDAI
jgi:hypothetical protein